MGFLCVSAGKESACNVRDLGSIPGLGRSHGEGKDYPLQYPDLENSKDYTVHGVAKSQTWLSDFHFYFILKIYTNKKWENHKKRGGAWVTSSAADHYRKIRVNAYFLKSFGIKAKQRSKSQIN